MSLNPLLESPPGAGFKDLDSTLKECIARFNHPQDPLAAWRTSFEEWIEGVKNFHQAKDRHIYQTEQADEVVWRFHRFLLYSLIGRGEHLALQLLALTARELARMQQHIMLLIKSAQERVAGFLLEMADRVHVRNEIELPMSRQDIADYLGLTIETVSRTLTQLENAAAIALPTSRHIVLCNRAALSRLDG